MRGQEFKEEIGKTLTELSDALSMTLGPYGQTTIVMDKFYNHVITKDGYTVLNRIMIEEDIPNTVLDIVRKISRKLVRKVGDGSTSSIVIANNLYHSLEKVASEYEKENIRTKDILDIIDGITVWLRQEISRKSIMIEDGNFLPLEDIASVSCNNNREHGKLVREIFEKIGRHGFVNIETSPSESTYYDIIEGLELPRGYINTLMVNQADNKTCVLNKAAVFMTDGVMDESDLPFLADLINNNCIKLGKSLVIIAKSFDHTIQNMINTNLIQNRNKGIELPILCVDIATASKDAQDIFHDIAATLGCKPLLKSVGQTTDGNDWSPSNLGYCKKVISTQGTTRMIDGNNDTPERRERKEFVKKLIEDRMRTEKFVDLDEEFHQLRKRLTILEGRMANLYIGGNSEESKETEKFLFEDAVFACRSALKFGYIMGGNLIIPRIIHEYMASEKEIDPLKKRILIALKEAFARTFETVLFNRYQDWDKCREITTRCISEGTIFNLLTYEYEGVVSTTSIVNSAETDIEILKSALSIISLIVTSNQFISVRFMN